MTDTKFVGSKIFEKIETDERVTPTLKYCLYCKVSSHGKDSRYMETDYQIELKPLTEGIRQCPACKRVYILSDPTKMDRTYPYAE